MKKLNVNKNKETLHHDYISRSSKKAKLWKEKKDKLTKTLLNRIYVCNTGWGLAWSMHVTQRRPKPKLIYELIQEHKGLIIKFVHIPALSQTS